MGVRSVASRSQDLRDAYLVVDKTAVKLVQTDHKDKVRVVDPKHKLRLSLNLWSAAHRRTTGCERKWWRWGRVELPVQNPSPGPTTSVSDDFRQPVGRPSAGCRPAQSRVPRSGLTPDYVTLVRAAPSLSDASTAREGEAASTLTLPPKRRGREQAACWQLLRFAAGLTRPDGTSARVPWQPSPVETTHPHGPNRCSGAES